MRPDNAKDTKQRLSKKASLHVHHLGAQHDCAEGQVVAGEGELGAKAGS